MKKHVIERPFSGAIVFWTVGDTSRDVLVQHWPTSLRDFLPNEITNAAALKAALGAIYAKRRVLIRPLEVEGSYAVVEETPTADGSDLRYETVLTAVVNSKGTVEVDGAGAMSASDIRSMFVEEKNRLPGIAVSKALVKVVEDLGGVPLRESGGVYWMPSGSEQQFQTIAEAVEIAGIEKPAEKKGAPPVNPNKVYSVLTPADERTCRAVVDALTSEVRAEIARIDRDIADGEVGQRALNNRADDASLLISKVSSYERIFGASLADLKESLSNISAQAAAAALAGGEDVEESHG